MSNVVHLRKILSEYKNDNISEALEFLDAIEKEIDDHTDMNRKLIEENRSLESELMEYQDSTDGCELLGLDTIHYSFDLGNIVIRESFNKWVESVKSGAIA